MKKQTFIQSISAIVDALEVFYAEDGQIEYGQIVHFKFKDFYPREVRNGELSLDEVPKDFINKFSNVPAAEDVKYYPLHISDGAMHVLAPIYEGKILVKAKEYLFTLKSKVIVKVLTAEKVQRELGGRKVVSER